MCGGHGAKATEPLGAAFGVTSSVFLCSCNVQVHAHPVSRLREDCAGSYFPPGSGVGILRPCGSLGSCGDDEAASSSGILNAGGSRGNDW